MSGDAPTQVGRYRLARRLVERHWLARSGMKIPTQYAYVRAWVVEEPGPDGGWRPVKYFAGDQEKEARDWAQGNPDD